jgi:prophage tail gpP-like protein
MPNPAEVATLVVAGYKFTAWESVWVQHQWPEVSPLFRFTAAEADPNKENSWASLRFRPGDECAIYLGKQLGIIGLITTRQVAYDANSHGVMLLGKGKTWLAGRASVITKTMTFDNKTFEQVAFEVLAPFPYIKPEVIGEIDKTPFKILRADIGVTVWAFLEALARERGVIIGSDHTNKFLLIGKHSYRPDNSLVEGTNILKGQILIDRQKVWSEYIFKNSAPADDTDNMSKQAHQEAKVASDIGMQHSPLMGVVEHPVWTQAEVMKRALYEKQWSDGTVVTANLTVQGWHQPNGFLWKAGGKYHVKTPMGLLDQPLKAKTVTFEQSSNTGTTTTLELVAPWLLNDTSEFLFNKGITIEEYPRVGTVEDYPEHLF